MCLFRKKKKGVDAEKLISRKVENKERKFGETDSYVYVPMVVEITDGKIISVPLLFTEREIAVAKARASRNMEDLVG